MLISQYTYVLTILDLTDEDRLDKIQCVINNFIAYNRYEMTSKCKSWISNTMLYGDPKDGGFNMINIKEFFLAIKTSWIHQYINGLDDHWADLIDLKLDINKGNCSAISKFGSENPTINKLIKAEVPGISQLFCALKKLKEAFWGHKEINDNR